MDSSLFPAPADGSPVPADGSVKYCDCFSCEETVVLTLVDRDMNIADTLKPLTVKPEEKIDNHNESIFKQSDFPLAFPHMLHGSRKAIIESRLAIGNGGQQATQSGASSARGVSNTRGGNRSAISTQDGGMGRRMRQSMSKVVGGGLGTDSSEDIGAGRTKGQVRF